MPQKGLISRKTNHSSVCQSLDHLAVKFIFVLREDTSLLDLGGSWSFSKTILLSKYIRNCEERDRQLSAINKSVADKTNILEACYSIDSTYKKKKRSFNSLSSTHSSI